MNISFSDRKSKILEMLDNSGNVKIVDFTAALAVSEITIRRDLARLEEEGLILKTRGGASKREALLSEMLSEKRIRLMEFEKRRIGQAAADMVQRGDVVFLDTGTTTLQVSRCLKSASGITVVTNSIHILAELRFAKDLNLILLGGTYRAGDYALSGPLTEKNLETFRAKLAFLGADGITSENGVTTNDMYTAEVTKLMMAHAETSVLVADHTKIGRSGSIKYAEVEDFGLLITDGGTTEESIPSMERLRVEVKLV